MQQLHRIAEEIYNDSPVLQELARLRQLQGSDREQAMREGVEGVLATWHGHSGFGVEIVDRTIRGGRASLRSREGYLRITDQCWRMPAEDFHLEITHEMVAYYSWRRFGAIDTSLPSNGPLTLIDYLDDRILRGQWRSGLLDE